MEPLEASATAVMKGIYTATSAELVVNRERSAAEKQTIREVLQGNGAAHRGDAEIAGGK